MNKIYPASLPINQFIKLTQSTEEKLVKLGLITLHDLLLHIPYRYEDKTRITAISDLVLNQFSTIQGEIKQSKNIPQKGKGNRIELTVADNSGTISITFFNSYKGMQNNLKPGVKITAFGEIKSFGSIFKIIHPEIRILKSNEEINLESNLTPIYHTTLGLKQFTIRKLVKKALEFLKNLDLDEILPSKLNKQQLSFYQSLELVHFPSPDISVNTLLDFKHPAQLRLIAEELLAQQVAILQSYQENKETKAIELPRPKDLINKFIRSLKFQPTNAQIRVLNEIAQDLQRNIPMMRLLQGDVGSGKTLVAAITALQALANKKQAVLMAPTEILALQQFENFKQWFEPLGIKVGLLQGSLKKSEKTAMQKQIASGEIQMIMGTHAVFQKSTIFNNLALIIIDEQHKFGVHQRLSLLHKGENEQVLPHQLIMTATPIPRTLAMTLYAHLEVSIIDELPKGRSPIKTVAICENRRDEIINRINQVCKKQQRQAYWVCKLIDDSEVMQAQAASTTALQLQKELPALKIGLLHGRMTPAEKAEIMQQFQQAEIDLLVATTVIEVGINVPNASLMIIENAESLGLAQLHQLRGRVGRGSVESFCVLMFKQNIGGIAKQRIEAMRQSNDGFFIAEQDLKLRGSGDILGKRQAGSVEFKIADAVRDNSLLPLVNDCAKEIIKDPYITKQLLQRWLYNSMNYIKA